MDHPVLFYIFHVFNRRKWSFWQQLCHITHSRSRRSQKSDSSRKKCFEDWLEDWQWQYGLIPPWQISLFVTLEFCGIIAKVGPEKQSQFQVLVGYHCLPAKHFDFKLGWVRFRDLIMHCRVFSVGQTDRPPAAGISAVDFVTSEVTFK